MYICFILKQIYFSDLSGRLDDSSPVSLRESNYTLIFSRNSCIKLGLKFSKKKFKKILNFCAVVSLPYLKQQLIYTSVLQAYDSLFGRQSASPENKITHHLIHTKE